MPRFREDHTARVNLFRRGGVVRRMVLVGPERVADAEHDVRVARRDVREVIARLFRITVRGAKVRRDSHISRPFLIPHRLIGAVVRVRVERRKDRGLFNKGKQEDTNAGNVVERAGPNAGVRLIRRAQRRTGSVHVVVVLNGKRHLLEVVRALHAPRGFARRLNCRKEQPNQNADDSDHDQQLDQREAVRLFRVCHEKTLR